MSLTLPQIIMWGHASKVNGLKFQEKMEWDRKDAEAERDKDKADPRFSNGKRMSEMTMDEMLPHMMGSAE